MFVNLCEITDDRLIKAKQGDYLEVFCVGIIYNIWGRRTAIKRYETGSTSDMVMLCDMFLHEDKMPHVSTDPVFDIEEIEQLIEDARNSKDPSTRFRAGVFYHSRQTFKNPYQFSQHSKIPYDVVHKAYNRFKEEIKSKCA